MWSNRKARFTIAVAIALGENLALWLSHRVLGYTMKDHSAIFGLVFLTDFLIFFGFAFQGVLASWLLAFRPEVYMRTIERSIANRNTKSNSN
jgi:hypothetical protein